MALTERGREYLERRKQTERELADGTAPRPTDEADSRTPRFKTVTLSEVTPERLSWLWPLRLPLGKLVTLDGDPGVGKSTLALKMAAIITTAGRWPDGTRCLHPGDVILMSAEDGLADTIRPRLDAARADVTKVHAIKGVLLEGGEGETRRMPTLADIDRLREQRRRLFIECVRIGAVPRRVRVPRRLWVPTTALLRVADHRRRRSWGPPLRLVEAEFACDLRQLCCGTSTIRQAISNMGQAMNREEAVQPPMDTELGQGLRLIIGNRHSLRLADTVAGAMRRFERHSTTGRAAPDAPDPGGPGKAPPSPNRWLTAGGTRVAAVMAAGVAVTLVSCSTSAQTTSTSTAVTTMPTVAPDRLESILLTTPEINTAMGATGMQTNGVFHGLLYQSDAPTSSNPDCLGALGVAEDAVYQNSGYTAVRGEVLHEPGDNPEHYVEQAAVSFPSDDLAQEFMKRSAAKWKACAGQHITITWPKGQADRWVIGNLVGEAPKITLLNTKEGAEGWASQRVLNAVGNLVLDVGASGFHISDQAGQIADKLAAKVTH
jgi:hypothetical protein